MQVILLKSLLATVLDLPPLTAIAFTVVLSVKEKGAVYFCELVVGVLSSVV